jgi:hypothetical protein
MLPIEETILEKLRSGPCCLDEVVTTLSNSSWGEIFAVVDRMSRDGRLLLHQVGYSSYQISLSSHFPQLRSATSEKGMQSSWSR